MAILILPTAAQNTNSTDTIKAFSLEEVEVVAKNPHVNKTAISTEISASPAAVAVVGRGYIAKQAFTSYGDLLRPLAGINVSNYQLGGVGYGVQLRGYVVTEHARDIAFFIDGVPQNQGSSIHTNGYVDLNPLIPEVLRRIEVVRGPFSPYSGDHAFGGTIAFETMDKLPSSLTLSGGTYGTVRGLATVGFGSGKNTGYTVLEGSRTAGYRDNNNEKHLNGFAKYNFPFLKGTASIRAQVYASDFGSAGYIVQGNVESGSIRKASAVNYTDGGTTQQQNVVFTYKTDNEANFTNAVVYVQHHDFNRIRTNVVGGPQRQDRDNRIWSGFDIRRTHIGKLGSMPMLLAGGIYLRADGSDNTRFSSLNGQKQVQNKDKQINTYTPAVYAQWQLQLTQRLKLHAGARYDRFYYFIRTGALDNEKPNATVWVNTGAFSPKAGLAFGVTKGVNLFANIARGVKSPSGYEENLFNPALKPSKLTSYEAGISGDDKDGLLHGLLTVYSSDQSGEIQADPLGNLLNLGNTRRKGVEAEGRAAFSKAGGFALFGNYTYVSARLRDGASAAHYVVNTPTYLATLGFDYDFGGAARAADNRYVLSVYDQLIGPKNLNTDGSIQSKAFHRLAGKLSYSRARWPGFRVFMEGIVYPGNGALQEVSFLSGGVLVTAPQAPATIQGGVRIPL